MTTYVGCSGHRCLPRARRYGLPRDGCGHQGWWKPAGQQDDAQVAVDGSTSMPGQQPSGNDCDGPPGYIRVEEQSACGHSGLSQTDDGWCRTQGCRRLNLVEQKHSVPPHWALNVAGLADVPPLPQPPTAFSHLPVGGVRSPPTESYIKGHRGTEMILKVRRYRRYGGTGDTEVPYEGDIGRYVCPQALEYGVKPHES